MVCRLLALVVLVGCGRLGFDAVGDDVPGGGGTGDPGSELDGGVGDGDGGPFGTGCEVTATCGARTTVPGGDFMRGNDARYPARIDGFTLDRFEVTVGRFRAFLDAGYAVQTSPPAANAGAHLAINGSGWNPAWNARLEPDTEALRARIAGGASATFTIVRGTGEDRPVNWVRWYEAFAFCIWDGGRLPTYAEQQFVAVGGSEQRAYPWSSPATSTAITPSHVAMGNAIEPVGAHSPAGDGRWGHADLVGNVDEWSLDYFGELPAPCTNCANLTTSATRLGHGYGYGLPANDYLATSQLHGAGPSAATGMMGFRCAR